MKTLVTVVILAGAAGMIFSIMAYLELRGATTGVSSPSPDAMPLTKLVGPELFDPSMAVKRPSELAELAFNRIYMIGGGSMFMLFVGAMLLLKRNRSSTMTSDESNSA